MEVCYSSPVGLKAQFQTSSISSIWNLLEMKSHPRTLESAALGWDPAIL